MKKKKIIVVVGTRAEVINFTSTILELKKNKNFDVKILHTGQHTNVEFMKKLDLPKPDYFLGESFRSKWSKKGKIASSIYATVWLLKIFLLMRRIFTEESPDVVFYQGNCMTIPFVIFAAKSASKKITLIHRESGLYSNRLFDPFLGDLFEGIGDYFGDILFAPNKTAEKTLKGMVVKGKIFMSGDPLTETVLRILKKRHKTRVFKERYIVVNVLHFENVVKRDRMEKLIEMLIKSPLKVIFPMSESVKGRLEMFNLLGKLKGQPHIVLDKPYDYPDFLNLVKNSEAIVTDGAGVQQEALILRIPCIFLGEHNVWIELENMGLIKSTGFDVVETLELLQEIKNRGRFYKRVKAGGYPFGDGKASKRIARFLSEELTGK
jgi:UDP-N-acetylglucosamine 2-epimerase (non-hydrolysing)